MACFVFTVFPDGPIHTILIPPPLFLLPQIDN